MKGKEVKRKVRQAKRKADETLRKKSWKKSEAILEASERVEGKRASILGAPRYRESYKTTRIQ